MRCERNEAVAFRSDRFLSPNITRRRINRVMVAAHGCKNSRRAKSSESPMATTNGKLLDGEGDGEIFDDYSNQHHLKVTSVKIHELMSKTDLINCYRLLMSEKLRLERFLSIMSKNNEMARNRLESDLLDAMMCIEDLKQALELRMARRRKIDPREAEERRYLIRQNKKLLNQLYDSAKKTERLELTKVEMKEQLELLDFQISEIENQKSMLEEELRRSPLNQNEGTQTEDDSDSNSNLMIHVQKRLMSTECELHGEIAKTAAAVAKQQHLENLVRELRRDNVDLRDQLSKLEDTENSLAESDKPLSATFRNIQEQLGTRIDCIPDSNLELNALRAYTKSLESDLQEKEKMHRAKVPDETMLTAADAPEQERMQRKMDLPESPVANGGSNVLLQETIKTFHALIAERDQELDQLRHYIRVNVSTDEPTGLVLPQLCESEMQTEPLIVTRNQDPDALKERCEDLASELQKTLDALPTIDNRKSFDWSYFEENCERDPLDRLIDSVKYIRQTIESKESSEKINLEHDRASNLKFEDTTKLNLVTENIPSLLMLPNTKVKARSKQTFGELNELMGGNDSIERMLALDGSTVGEQVDCSVLRNPTYYDSQLETLKKRGELEFVFARINILQRRCSDLESRIQDLNGELSRFRAECKSTEASLFAARRTEAALRRRLLAAMDMQGTGSSSSANRYSVGSNLSDQFKTRNALELEAELIKSEATNSSLLEAAQLDRSRFHEYTMQINQLEAERRASLDRISVLQAAEATAQRSLVRLQALYEDMLLEYSESRNQESLRNSSGGSQSNRRNAASADQNSHLPCDVPTDSTFQMPNERSNGSESDKIDFHHDSNSDVKKDWSVFPKPVGRCMLPTCIEVRHLLEEFQHRFDEVIQELMRTQKCLDAIQMNSDVSVCQNSTDYYGLDLIQSVRNQIEGFKSSVRTPVGSGTDSEDLLLSLTNCSDSLGILRHWLFEHLKDSSGMLMCLRKDKSMHRIPTTTGDDAIKTYVTNDKSSDTVILED